VAHRLRRGDGVRRMLCPAAHRRATRRGGCDRPGRRSAADRSELSRPRHGAAVRRTPVRRTPVRRLDFRDTGRHDGGHVLPRLRLRRLVHHGGRFARRGPRPPAGGRSLGDRRPCGSVGGAGARWRAGGAVLAGRRRLRTRAGGPGAAVVRRGACTWQFCC
jgi:hypothetical protein